MGRFSLLSVSLIGLATFASLSFGQSGPAFPPGPPGVWARVDSEIITKGEIMEMHRISDKVISPAQALDLRIMELAMRGQMKSKGISVSKKEVDAAYAKALKDNIRNGFIKKARRKGFTKERLRRAIENEMLLDKRMETELTDGQYQAYFKKNAAQYSRQYRLSLITIAIKAGRGSKKALTRAKALLARLEKGEPWEDVCREESDDPLAPFHAGDRGWILPRQERVNLLLNRAKKMKLGEISKEPVRAGGGYHILRITDERIPEVTFKNYHDKARVRFALRAETLRRLYRRWLQRTIVTRFAGAPPATRILPQ